MQLAKATILGLLGLTHAFPVNRARNLSSNVSKGIDDVNYEVNRLGNDISNIEDWSTGYQLIVSDIQGLDESLVTATAEFIEYGALSPSDVATTFALLQPVAAQMSTAMKTMAAQVCLANAGSIWSTRH